MTTTTEIDFGDFGDNCSSYLGIIACSISTHEELERTDPAPKSISATARQQVLQRVQLNCARCLLSANVQTMDWWEKTCSAVPQCMDDLRVCHRLQLVTFMYDWSIHGSLGLRTASESFLLLLPAHSASVTNMLCWCSTCIQSKFWNTMHRTFACFTILSPVCNKC